MPEPLALRTIQVPTTASNASGPSGRSDAASAVDFQAVLARQLGAPTPESAPAALPQSDDAEVEQHESDTPVADLNGAASEAALQLRPQMLPVVPPEAATARNARFEPPEGADIDTQGGAARTSIEAIPRTDLPGQAAGLAADGEDQPLQPFERMLESDPLQQAGNRLPESGLGHGLERPAEVSARHATGAANVLDEPIPMGRRPFASELGDRVLWMASNGRQVAELRIDPPQLGPVEVRLSITGEQATLSLVSAQAAVREALQASIPRLQDMIQSIGLELGSVHVGSESFARQQEQGERPPHAHVSGQQHEPLSLADATQRLSHAIVGNGLVDVYA
ncbi:MAG: flagellar hook-length control protein FliK [Burkholderiales bacterium]|nr:flagellar hook-length control protein FliK [Burkholderiales bacterium]